MDFSLSERMDAALGLIRDFVDNEIIPMETAFLTRPFRELLPDLEKKRAMVKQMGLWAPGHPRELGGMGLDLVDLGLVSEALGRSPLGHFVFGCHAPDAGNVEILHLYGTPEQKERWLGPLVEGTIRSCFSMTEVEMPGSNPVMMETTAVADGDDYVINGQKWYTTAADGAAFAIVMAVTDPEAPPHRRATMIIVPTDTPGFDLVRNINVMGHTGDDYFSHAEILYHSCRVPRSNLLGPEGHGLRDRPGAPRPRTHPPLHALDRRLQPSLRPDVRAGRRAAHLARPDSRRQGHRPRLGGREPRRNSGGANAHPADGLEDRSAGLEGGAPGHLDDQVRGRRNDAEGGRPRPPGSRRSRDDRRHPAGVLLPPRTSSAYLRRCRRGAEAVARQTHPRRVPSAVIDSPRSVRPGEELDGTAIGRYLKSLDSDLVGPIEVAQFRSGASNLTYLVTVGDRSLVLRRPPHGRKAKTAHDMSREVRMLTALAEAYPFVPKVIAYCEDLGIMGSDFYVMERIEGIILRKDLPRDLKLSREEIGRLCRNVIDKLVELHKIDFQAAGLDDFGKPEGYVRRQVEGWSTRFRAAHTPNAPSYEGVM